MLVAAGVLRDADGRVLLAQRACDDHAGRWEFPGGKVEPGESVHQALVRELHEELGLEIAATESLIRVPHRSPTQRIALDVRMVTAWSGDPLGREGQALRWASLDELAGLPMPPADLPAVAALRMPRLIAITPEDAFDDEALVAAAGALMERDVDAIQVRRPSLSVDRNRAAALRIRQTGAARGWQGSVLLNADIEGACRLGLGLHLRAEQLRQLESRPRIQGMLTAACHDATELSLAVELNVDAVLIGSVCVTPTHPERAPMGWPGFVALRESCGLPMYALGGLTPDDFDQARSQGAQGVAGIRGFWH